MNLDHDPRHPVPRKRLSRFPAAWGRVSAGIVAAVLFSLGATAQVAQQGPDPAKQYADALASFGAGNYPEAAQKLVALIETFKDASDQVKLTLEPVYYTLGAAYFNAKDYDNTIKTYQDYKTKFKNGEHAGSVLYSLAASYYALKKYDEAIVELKLLEPYAPLRQKALYLHGFILNEQKKYAEAVEPLQAIIANGLNTSQDIDAALLLASIYTKLHQYDQAGHLLANIKKNFQLVANKVRFNSLIIDLGDKLFADGLPRQAIEVYRVAQTREELVKAQEATIARLKELEQQELVKFRQTGDVGYVESSVRLRGQITDANAALDNIKKVADFEPNLLLRLGRAYYECDRQWEALLVYEKLLEKFPDAKETELTTFGRILALKDINKPKEALDACEAYLAKYPQGVTRSTVIYLRGEMALQNKEYAKAVDLLTKGIAEDPQSTYVDAMTFLIGEAKFAAGDHAGALDAYQKYIAAFPDGGSVEDARYRMGMAAMLATDYPKAIELLNAYLTTYPDGNYNADVSYRVALATFAQQKNDEALALSEAWLKARPNDRQAGEVLSLEGDIYAAMNKPDEAADKYAAAVMAGAAAENDEVVNYALNEVGKIYQAQRQWEKSIALFEGFIKAHPKNQAVVSCAYYLARARDKMGQREEAKKFLTDVILKEINDPTNSSIERLLTQLAQLTAKRPAPPAPPTPAPTPAPVVLASGSPAPTPVPTPTPSPEELRAQEEKEATERMELAAKQTREASDELNKLLKISGTEECIYRARRTFAQSELMKARHQPDEAVKLIGDIGKDYRPQDLSAALLGLAGDNLLASGQTDKAAAMFDHLVGHYPDSEFADYGYVGLGQIAFAKEDYKQALRDFKAAKDEVMPGQKLKDAYVGEARSLLALDKLDEAEELFKIVASKKEWRGEDTALSIYSLGQIEEKRKKYAEAIAYYQRVYVGYQKYPVLVAKSYLDSARAFELLGKRQEAINTYREVLRNDKLKDLQSPALAEAQQRLNELGAP